MPLVQHFHILGRRMGAGAWTSTTVMNDVKEFDTGVALFPVISTADSLEVVSSDANDTGAGTGVQQVNIVYIDASNNIASVTKTMNGLTPVAVGGIANEILWMEAQAVGSNFVSAGNILLRKVTGGAGVEQITAGGNKSRSAKFMVPAGYMGMVTMWTCSTVTDTLDARLRATVRTLDRALVGPYLYQDGMYLPNNAWHTEDIDHSTELPPLARVKISAVAGALNVRADVSFCVTIRSM